MPNGSRRRNPRAVRIFRISAIARDPGQQAREHHPGGEEVAGHAEREHAAQALQAAVIGHHQRREADHGGEGAKYYGDRRGMTHAVAARLAAEILDHVDPVVHAHAEHQGERDHVGLVEGDFQQGHGAKRLDQGTANGSSARMVCRTLPKAKNTTGTMAIRA